jgi:signal transduction histidine kinase
VDTVIRNLLSNSIKYSHANRDVVIGTSKEASTVYISVKDEGVGMPEDVQNDLFTLKANTPGPPPTMRKEPALALRYAWS